MWCVRFGKNLKRSCRNITLHGFINIFEAKSIWEILFWIVVQLLCFTLCLWLMTIHWLRYQSRPTVTTIKSTAYPISDIPFPAVTVCNSNIVYKKSTQPYEEMLLKEGIDLAKINEFFKYLKYLIHLSVEDETNIPQFKDIEEILNDKGVSTETLMKSLAHPCNALLSECTWSGITYNCSEMFRPIKSGLGFCCSFNYHNNNNITGESYPTARFSKPMVADGAGMAHGIGLTLHVDSSQYIAAVLPFFAVFILIHPIWDYGDLSAFSVALQPGDFAMVQLVPTVFNSDAELRAVSVDRRHCWFETEGHLKLTQDYSFTNCVIECKANAIRKLCGCVPYYFPAQAKHKQCNLQDIPCLKKYEVIYNSIKIAEKVAENSTLCNCLPQCADVSYDGYMNAIRSGVPSTNSSTARIYYDHSWCVEYSMSLNLTWDMLLASFGGIFGLCLGGSLISLVEIIYYLLKSIYLTISQGKHVTTVNKFNKNVFISPKY